MIAMQVTLAMAEYLDVAVGGVFAHATRMKDEANETTLRLLVDIITFLMTTGAVKVAADGTRNADFTRLRQFFLGVMHWPPDHLANATLQDLQDAFAGYKMAIKGLPNTPEVQSMTSMMQNFPDQIGA